jgi:4-diphosphocytidyl-2-C-methyl-D-erythritol kinase
MFIRRRGSSIEVNTPAKLNLFLEVLKRRDDGFHEIETLMVAVNIFDTIFISTRSDGGITLNVRWAEGAAAKIARASSGLADSSTAVPDDDENLAKRALVLLRKKAGVEVGASIRLVKRIPAAAGLGGASSDAAAVLFAANEIWQLNWQLRQLAEVAAELGSDVPFFLVGGERGSGAAVCTGRGDVICPISPVARFHFVIVRPQAGLPTAEVYRNCKPAKQTVSVQAALESIRVGNPQGLAGSMMNRLERAAEKLAPWLKQVRSDFESLGLIGYQMSGSGSSYFGVCRNARHARRVSQLLQARGYSNVFRAANIAAPALRTTVAA